jgi:hypothetical protein
MAYKGITLPLPLDNYTDNTFGLDAYRVGASEL